MMVALNRARDILLDPTRRAELDRRGRGGVRGPAESATASEAAGARCEDAGSTGPPPGNASGSRLDFGRYAGWSRCYVPDPGRRCFATNAAAWARRWRFSFERIELT